MNKKLRYRISEWEQATKCLSNLSDNYHIHVKTIEYSPDLSGKVIQVSHNTIGILFSVMLDVKGDRVDPESNTTPMSTKEILNNLHVFGFDIEYSPEANLPIAQKEYLTEISKLGMDKIRIIITKKTDTLGNKRLEPVLVAFSSIILSNWLLNTYTCKQDELFEMCGNGYAIVLDKKDYDWSWLTYVANISDILSMK